MNNKPMNLTVRAEPPRHLLPRRLASWVFVVQLMCVLGALILVAVPLWFWSSPDWVARMSEQLAGVRDVSIGPRTLWWGALLSLLPVTLGLYALWQLWCLFRGYALGRVFTRPALAHLRRFAWSMLAGALLAPLLRAALSVLLTLGNPPGRRQLVVGLSWDDYIGVLLAVVLIVIASVMAEAVRLAEDNEGFV